MVRPIAYSQHKSKWLITVNVTQTHKSVLLWVYVTFTVVCN